MKKRILSFLIVICLMMNMLAPSVVNAGEKAYYSITITNGAAGHIYEIYQIFSGDLSDDGKLSNVEWGASVTADGQAILGDAATVAAQLASGAIDAREFALEVSEYLSDDKISIDVDTDNSATVYQAGYYLMKDADESLEGKTGEAYTAYILKVAADVSITPKTGVPALVHKVRDYNDTTGADDWYDAADYDIGDDVEFKLEANIASNYTSYDTYKLNLYTTLDTGLSVDADTVEVYANGLKVDSNGYSISVADNKMTVTFNDLKSVSCVDSSSQSVVCGITDNTTLTVYYNALLGSSAVLGTAGNSATAYMEYSNNPNNSAKIGTTVEDKVKVFTYEVVVNKVDDSGNALAGALFELEKVLSDGTKVTVDVVTDTNGSTFNFTGLDDGNYVLTEVETPEGYNTIVPVYFTVTASHDTSSDDATLTALTAQTTAGTAEWTTALAAGTLTTSIVNKSGSILPSTGGIGSVLFIVAGIVLMGLVIFIVVKRKNKEDK